MNFFTKMGIRGTQKTKKRDRNGKTKIVIYAVTCFVRGYHGKEKESYETDETAWENG